MLNLLAGLPYRVFRLGSNYARRDEIISKAMAFRMDHIVERFRRQMGVAEFQARELERELKRYLAMCAIYPKIVFPMEGPVDELWHVFLTHTADYRRFCDSVAGRMIHHWPAGGSDPQEGRARRTDSQIFIRTYEDLFGTLPSSNIWPFAKRQGTGAGPAASHADGHGGSGWSVRSWFSRDYDGGVASGGSDGGGGCGGGGD